MKNTTTLLLSVWAMLVVPTYGIKAQNFNCLFQPGTILQDQNASPCNAGTCYREMTNEDILKLPIVEIRVAFHFIASNGNNFQCSNPEIEATYAPTVINKLLDGANTLLTSPAKNEFGNSPIVPDTRIRLVLLNGNADPCSSFFFYPSQGNLSYQNNALDIIVYDHPTAIGISGQVNIIVPCALIGTDFVPLFHFGHEKTS